MTGLTPSPKVKVFSLSSQQWQVEPCHQILCPTPGPFMPFNQRQGDLAGPSAISFSASALKLWEELVYPEPGTLLRQTQNRDRNRQAQTETALTKRVVWTSCPGREDSLRLGPQSDGASFRTTTVALLRRFVCVVSTPPTGGFHVGFLFEKTCWFSF